MFITYWRVKNVLSGVAVKTGNVHTIINNLLMLVKFVES